MAQIVRPISTISSDGGWTVTSAVLPSDALDESVADDDTTYIAAMLGTGSVTIGLGSPASEPSTKAITITVRNRVPTAIVGPEQIVVTVYSGTTLLGTGTITPASTSYANDTVSITPTAAIDWDDLRVKLDGTADVNGLRVTQLYATLADGATALSARTGRAARMLVNTATIRRKTEGQAATGHSYATYADIYSVVPCNVQTRTGAENMAYQRETGMRSGVVYFSPDTDILNTDRLTTIAGAGAGGFTGCTLEITSPPMDHAGRGAYLACNWRETKGGPSS